MSDEATRQYLQSLLGGFRGEEGQHGRRATAGALQQLDQDRALLVAGAELPAVVRLTPWWKR